MTSYVLIIGEISVWLRDVTAALGQRDFYTELATSDSEGLLAAITFCPDVVLIETGTGRIDGCQVARALRTLPETRDIAILAIAAPTTHSSLSEKSCDFDGAITSNAEPEIVIDAVRAAIAGRSPQATSESSSSEVSVAAPTAPASAPRKTRKLFLNAANTPIALPVQPVEPDQRGNLFAKWPTTKWFAIPHSMAAAMAAGGAEVLTAEEMVAKTLRNEGGTKKD
jgi:CheY-like chemotaxis protein